MPETVLIADPDAIRRDLTYMVQGWDQLTEPVKFEVRAFREHGQPQSALFRPDWIDDAVDWIASVNASGCNTYVVRNPIRASVVGSASDADVVAAMFLWADFDDGRAAQNVLKWTGPKYSAAVVTGTIPSTRVHTYWRLDAPCYDLSLWRDTQASIAAHLGSDRTVINPSRIMRIAGTIAYPAKHKVERGYIRELATIRTEYDDPRAPVSIEQMRRAFGQSASETAKPGIQIDTGAAYAPALDRDRTRIQALSGMEWHNAVIRLVASYVARGLSDDEIHGLTDPLTLQGYTVDQTRAEVQKAINGARRKGWTPEATDYATPTFDAPAAPQNAAAAIEWFDDVEPALSSRYLIKGVLDAEAMSVVYGPSNSGKTFFALDLAFHVAAGLPWRGLRTASAGVLYLAAEGGRGVANRIAALREETGAHSIPFALRRAGMDLLKDQADLQTVYDLATNVRERAGDLPLLIVIDTLSRVMAGGDENNASDMTALIRNIDALRQATNAHVMLIHHSGKDTAKGARGHSSLRAATDTEIEVGNEDGNRAAIVTKQRDWTGGETFAFGLKTVTLGRDSDGDEVTSCVVEIADVAEFEVARSAAKGRGKNQLIIMEAFDQMVAEGMATGNPGGVGMPEPGQFWAVDTTELRKIAQGKMVGDNAAKLFRTAWEALTGPGGIFMAGNNLAWRVDRRKGK